MKNFLSAAFLLSTLACGVQASPVTVTFLNGGPVNDGSSSVLPYQIQVNGVNTSATCYDIYDSVSNGQSWIANSYTVGEAATMGYFSSVANAYAKYEAVAWLSAQAYSTAQNQIDLQHDIWNIFAPGRYTVTTGMQTYLNALTVAQNSNYTGFNFGTFRFLEQVGGVSGNGSTAQGFVIGGQAPEPGTILMLAGGLLLVGIGTRKRASATK